MAFERTSTVVETKQAVVVQVNVGFVLGLLVVSASFVLDAALLAAVVPLVR